MSKSIIILFFTLTIFHFQVGAQTDKNIHPNGYNIFYSSDSIVVSEGYMHQGKPDGYWKNYYANGQLKSEGNRKDFLLDSLWRFYGEEGQLTLEIEYVKGMKNGYRTTYQSDEITREYFENDIKQGYSYLLFENKSVKSKIPFVNGLEEGVARDYDEEGNLVQLVYYKKGYIIERERINRYDANRKRHGKWKWFFEDELTVQREGNYKNGLKNGYWKEYDLDGNLISATKYIDGEKQEKAEELVQLDVRTDYYPDGTVKVVATYSKEGVPEGVRREYNKNGEVEKSFIFKKGRIVGEGIFTDAGQRQGNWKEYYSDGKLKATGRYNDDKKEGSWKFYYRNGQLEQVGKYVNDQPDSLWRWYYSTGKILREEHFYQAEPDGLYSEFDLNGNLITTGDYLEGKKEGFWTLETGGYREEGDYSEGLKNGLWKAYYPDGELAFEGKYVDNLPNGKHQWRWPNGKLKKEASFVMGRRSGEMKKYNADGSLLIVVSYKAGREVKYDGIEADLDE